MNIEWNTQDWVALAILAVFLLLVWLGTSGVLTRTVRRADPNNWPVPAEDSGYSYGTPTPSEPVEDAYDDGPSPVEEVEPMSTFYVNGDPLCVAQFVETEDGFWSFVNDVPDELVMIYAPRPGDTLTSEIGEAF